MKKSPEGLIHKDGTSKAIKKSNEGFDEPSRKDLINSTLYGLQDALRHYEKEFLDYDKKNIPRDFLHIFWGLRNEVNDFLNRFDGLHLVTKSGKTIGRNKELEAMEIAIKVVEEFQTLNNSKNLYPTGQYLYEKVNEKINERVLRREPSPMEIKLRTCQYWIKRMKEGSFP